jgi:hypothetical protein
MKVWHKVIFRSMAAGEPMFFTQHCDWTGVGAPMPVSAKTF